jgi:hypothetical protein
MFLLPIIFPVKVPETKIAFVEKNHFMDKGYEMIRWGNDAHSLVTFKNPNEWSKLVIENFKNSLPKNV